MAASKYLQDIGTTTATYYFDGSDTPATDPGGVWTNDANAFDSDPASEASTSTNGSSSTNYLMGGGTNAPAVSDSTIIQVRFRVYRSNTLGIGLYTTLTAPTGGWTWAKISALEVRLHRTDDGSEIKYVNGTVGTAGWGQTLGTASVGEGGTSVGNMPCTYAELEVTYSTPNIVDSYLLEDGSGYYLIDDAVAPTTVLNTGSDGGGVATYHFDGNLGIVDGANQWTNDANAFNGNTTDSASTAAQGATNYLRGYGTTAPSSGGTITQVRARMFGDAADPSGFIHGLIYTTGEGELLGTPVRSGAGGADWGSYVTLTAPSGGWTWATLQAIGVKSISYPDIGGTATVYKAEIEVTSTVIPTPFTTATPTLEATATDDFNEVRYNFQVDTVNTFDSVTPATYATPAMVQVTGSNGSGGTITSTYTSTPTAGNLLVAFVYHQGASAPTISGWTAGAASTSSDNTTSRMFYKIADGTEGLITGSTGTLGWTMTLLEYSNIDSTTPFLVENNQLNANTTVSTTPSVTPTSSVGALIVFAGVKDANITWSNPSINASSTGVTSRRIGTIGSSATTNVADRMISSTSGSYQGTITSSAGAVGTAPIMVFRAKLVPGTPLLTKISGTDPGFLNTVTGGDTDPFNSGEKVSYTTTSLSDGTYYWRARGIDPLGSNTYGAWSTTRSFTVTTGGGGSTGQIKVYNGTSFVAKPVKVWTGSAWVTKSVKRWNGSAWITTPY